jgi:serine/threonine protein kinase
MSSATGPYPTTRELNGACQNPGTAFVTDYLQTAKFRQFGLPIFSNFLQQGRFAAVSRAELADGRTLGIRFLKSRQPGLQERYETLSKVFIRSNIEDNTVRVELKPEELILPSGKWDLIEMEWVNGQTLSTEVKRLLEQGDIRSIRALSEELQKLAAKMASAEVSHGDISPENIMVNDGHLVLVDYDSFWSEELKSLPYNVGPSKLQHPKALRNPGKLADRVAFSILRLGFVVLINNPEKFASADGHLEGHRFVFDVDSLSKGDPSVELIPESERQLYELLMSVLAGSYKRVEELDQVLFPEIRLRNKWVTIRSITPRDLKIPEARTKISDAGIVVKRVNNNDSVSEQDRERAIQVLNSGQDSSVASLGLRNPRIIHLVAIANEQSISLRSLRTRLSQVGVPIYSSPTEHILLRHWNLVKDAVTETDSLSNLKQVVQVSNDVIDPHVAFAKSIGIDSVRYEKLARSLFPGWSQPSVSVDVVSAKMNSILAIDTWRHVKPFSGLPIVIDLERSTLDNVALLLSKTSGYLRALLLLYGDRDVEDPTTVFATDYLRQMLAPVGVVLLKNSVESNKIQDLSFSTNDHDLFARSIGLNQVRYGNVFQLLFPGTGQSSVSVAAVKEKMQAILPIKSWQHLRTYGQRNVKIEGEGSSLGFIAGTLGIGAKYLVALLLLEGVIYIESVYRVIPNKELISLLTSIGLKAEGRIAFDQIADELGVTRTQMVRLAESYGFSGDLFSLELSQLANFSAFLEKIEVHKYVRSSVSGRYLLLDPSLFRFAVLANSLGISYNCLIVLLMMGGFKGNPTYWTRILAQDSKFQASEIPNISAALGVKIMLKEPGATAKKETTESFRANQPNLHDAVAVELGLSKARYLNVVQLLFPGRELSTVSSESVKVTMSSILPIDQWKNLQKYGGRTLRIPDGYLSLNDFSKVLGASVHYLRALFLVEGVNYFYSLYNTFSLSQMKTWFERIGVKVEVSEQIASSGSFRSKPANPSLHDELATSFGITKQNYSNVVRLLFPNTEMSLVSTALVSNLMESILPLDQWKFVTRFTGRSVELQRIPQAISEVAPLLKVEPSYIVALLLCEGISYLLPSERISPEEMGVNLGAVGLLVTFAGPPQRELPFSTEIRGGRKKRWWRFK